MLFRRSEPLFLNRNRRRHAGHQVQIFRDFLEAYPHRHTLRQPNPLKGRLNGWHDIAGTVGLGEIRRVDGVADAFDLGLQWPVIGDPINVTIARSPGLICFSFVSWK